MSIRQPTYSNMHDGLVVLIDGYQAGLTVIALAECLSSRSIYPHLNPTSAYFYTNVYRWALRYFSLIPHWLSGHGGNIVETHRTWRRRFYYMEEFMPKWMRHLFPYVEKSEWDREEHEMKKFKKYAEAAFGKHYRFPNKEFNNWLSQLTFETAENLDSDNSIAVNAFKVHE